MCRWELPFAQNRPVSVRLAQCWFRFHARTFQAFEAGSPDTKETRRRLEEAAAGNLRHPFLLPLYATNRAFLRMNAPHAGFVSWAVVHQNIRESVANCRLLKLLTCESTYRSPTGARLRQGGLNGYEENSSLHNGRRLKTAEWASQNPINCVYIYFLLFKRGA